MIGVIFIIAQIIILLLYIRVLLMVCSPGGVNFDSRKNLYFLIGWVFLSLFNWGLLLVLSIKNFPAL